VKLKLFAGRMLAKRGFYMLIRGALGSQSLKKAGEKIKNCGLKV